MTDNTRRGPEGSSPQFRRAAPRDSRANTGEQGNEYLSEDEWRARRRPQSVSEIVDRFMDKVGGGRAAPAGLLAARWGDVVGPQFAAKTRPGSCDGGRLVVLVADGATASKMRFLTSQILQKATQIVGADTVTSISFRVTPTLGP
ncbi:MAG: DUF721 domain-containing protein [bacterium]|nr:DUF721 domain-containing protein [bacterium]